jgi:hypothetical protein
MTNGAAAAAAAIAQAIKASGSIVKVEPQDFTTILQRATKPLVVKATGGLFRTKYQYLTNYKGLTFFTSSTAEVYLPGEVEVITAGKIWIPQ